MSCKAKAIPGTLLMPLLVLCLAGCAGHTEVATLVYQPTPSLVASSATSTPLQSVALTPEPSSTPSPSATPTSMPTSTPTVLPTPTPRVARSVDLVAFQSNRNGAWFSASLDTLLQTLQRASSSFDIQTSAIKNRRDGKIAPTLLGGYVFLQFGDISPALFNQHANTIGSCFIRSALLSFVDYANNRVLGWDRKATDIPMDVRGIIRVCNQKQIPVFVEINYSDYAPGSVGTGVETLQRADNLAGTITFLKSLKAQGLHIEGVTFGDEIGDEAGYGDRQPTIGNSDLISRFINYARALKSEFPTLKVYAFDSYIGATRGQVSTYWDYFQKIRQAEIQANQNLLDGFVFRESYTYMDDQGRVLDSQLILDDTESLYRDAPVYRYDVNGTTHKNPDRDYLHQIINQTNKIFGRTIDIGLTEYLPAGPVQIDESDTSRYADMDFVLHYTDVVGIYAELGLDTVSTWMFANRNDQAKCYIDRQGHPGANYPIHAQLAQYFAGDILNVDRSADYNQLKVKVYAARVGSQYFVMLLNKDVANESTVHITMPGQFDLILRLPRRSYTSLIVDEKGITVSGIGN